MKRFIYLSIIAISSILTTACTDDETPFIETSRPDEILKTLNILVNNEIGVLTTGNIPNSNQNDFPSIISYPDKIQTTRLSQERINLVFEVDSNIEEIYFTIEGASEYYTFINNNGLAGAETESVSITIEIPSSINEDSFNTNISVKDKNQSISTVTQVHTIINEEDAEKRLIHFADYSYNSKLSTLNFDTAEVINIGSTGYKLTDIAFFDNVLYGISGYSDLITIDLDTGEGTLVGKVDIPNINALEGSDTTLYGATRGGDFITIDPLTAKVTVIDSFSSGAMSSGDLVFDGSKSFLYGTLVVPGSSTDQLVTINPTTGVTEFIGETGFKEVWGLAFFRNQLIGLTTNGEFIIIDPKTGKGTYIETTQAFSAGGAAANIK